MRPHTLWTSLLVPSCLLRISATAATQQPLLSNPASAYPNSHTTNDNDNADDDGYHRFSHDIRRVAVIGAGPSGLQAAAALIEEGLEVRLFERADQPAGNWYYRDIVPVDASFPLSICVPQFLVTAHVLTCCLCSYILMLRY